MALRFQKIKSELNKTDLLVDYSKSQKYKKIRSKYDNTSEVRKIKLPSIQPRGILLHSTKELEDLKQCEDYETSQCNISYDNQSDYLTNSDIFKVKGASRIKYNSALASPKSKL